MFLKMMRISDILFNNDLPSWDFLMSAIENVRPKMVRELLKRSYWYDENQKQKGFCLAVKTGRLDLVEPFLEHFREMMYGISGC